jgi:hypothetical protein
MVGSDKVEKKKSSLRRRINIKSAKSATGSGREHRKNFY